MSNETWLRVVLYEVDDPADAESLEWLEDSIQLVVRELATQPGFLGGYWGFDQVAHTLAAVTYWDSLDAIEAAVRNRLAALREERRAHGFRVLNEANVRLFALPDLLARGPY